MRPLAAFLAVVATILGTEGATVVVGVGDPTLGPKLIAVAVIFAALASLLAWASGALAERRRLAAVREIIVQHRSGNDILNRMRPLEASTIRQALIGEHDEWKKTTRDVIKKRAPSLLPEWENPPGTNVGAGVPDPQLVGSADDLFQRLNMLSTFLAHLRC